MIVSNINSPLNRIFIISYCSVHDRYIGQKARIIIMIQYFCFFEKGIFHCIKITVGSFLWGWRGVYLLWILYYKKVIDAILSKMLIGAYLFISKCWCIYILCFQNVLWPKSQTTKKEIGTIIQRDGKVIPIEVKSGNTCANSLKSIMKNNKDISL